MTTKAATPVFGHLWRAALLGAAPEITDGQLLEAFVTRQRRSGVRRAGPPPWAAGIWRLPTSHRAHPGRRGRFSGDLFGTRSQSFNGGAAKPSAAGCTGSLTGPPGEPGPSPPAVGREKQVETMPQIIAQPPRSVADWEPILDDELSRLADKFRLPLVLCDLEGQPCKQVALKLKIPVGTLFSRLSRARRRLAQRLRQRGVTVSGGALATMFDGKAVLANVPPLLVSSTIKAATTVAAGARRPCPCRPRLPP